ncbi:hypothetical protein FRB99_000391, partial [Tulasnella sp. 403]
NPRRSYPGPQSITTHYYALAPSSSATGDSPSSSKRHHDFNAFRSGGPRIGEHVVPVDVTPRQDTDDHEYAMKLQRELQNEAMRDAQIAANLQRQFDAEDNVIRQEHFSLYATAQKQFDCKICLDKHPLDSLAVLEGCDHEFCRECLKNYVSTSLKEMKFPIPCPVCTTDPKLKDRNPGGQ